MIDRLKLIWNAGAPEEFQMLALLPIFVWRTIAADQEERDELGERGDR